MVKWKLTAIVCFVVMVLALAGFLWTLNKLHELQLNGDAGLGLGASSNLGKPIVHVTVTFWQYGRKVYVSEHPGAVTNFGLNVTFAKWTGNSTFYNMTAYNLNSTYIGIGYHSSGPNATSTILDGEWNRTSGTQHDLAYNQFNITAIFHPDAGPYSANCIGIYLEAAGHSLMAYDTISPAKTGIDDTFTITVEFRVSATG